MASPEDGPSAGVRARPNGGLEHRSAGDGGRRRRDRGRLRTEEAPANSRTRAGDGHRRGNSSPRGSGQASRRSAPTRIPGFPLLEAKDQTVPTIACCEAGETRLLRMPRAICKGSVELASSSGSRSIWKSLDTDEAVVGGWRGRSGYALRPTHGSRRRAGSAQVRAVLGVVGQEDLGGMAVDRPFPWSVPPHRRS